MSAKNVKILRVGETLAVAQAIQEIYVPSVKNFSNALTERLLPSFNNLTDEANTFLQAEFQRLSALPFFCKCDSGDLAELAIDNAAFWYSNMVAVRQSVINLLAVGIRHLFEQQVFYFAINISLASREKADYNADIKLLGENGVKYQLYSSWPTLEELRHVCNTVKHAEGSSAHQLKSLRPDLFLNPKMAGLSLFNRSNLVIQPLAGEDIYLCETDIEKYTVAIEHFWIEVNQNLSKCLL